MSPTRRAISTASLLSSARRSRWSEKLSSIASRASRRARRAGSCVADRRERLLEHLHERVVDDAAGHLPRRAVAERRLGEQARGVERARDVGRLAERRVRGGALAGLGLRVAAREQQRAAALLVGRRVVERAQRDLVQPRRLLVGEHAGRALGGALGVVDRLRRAALRRREEEVVGELGQRRLGAPFSSRSSASPTRRCSRARRVSVRPS